MTADANWLDKGNREVLDKMRGEGIDTVWDRLARQEPQCGFGKLGLCCKLCNQGPCRIDPAGHGPQKGVCGADADTIAARNFIRHIAAGSAAHTDHARAVVETLLDVCRGKAGDYEIKEPDKVYMLADVYGLETEGRSIKEIAGELAEKTLAEFGRTEGTTTLIARAPKKRREVWKKNNVEPRGIDREITACMSRTHIGVEHDYRELIRQGTRTALADGWGGSMLGTEIQDILFGRPVPVRAEINLGVISSTKVNVVVHGHEPTLSEMIVTAARSPDMLEAAKAAGAEGIQVSGCCCTANELLMRHGVPSAGTFLQQELIIGTGAIEAMVVDIQCIMPAVADTVRHYHTKLISTSRDAHFPGAVHVEFDEHRALEIAKEIVQMAIDNFERRDPSKVYIPDEKTELIAGFSHETILYMLGGRFRASYRPLNDNIMNGRIRGVAGVVGCNNAKVDGESFHTILVKELIKNDILCVQTGCSAGTCARVGLLKPEMKEFAGPGLREVCETVGIPPVLHSGSCVDNSRILIACTELVNEGGLGEDISDLPVVGLCPEWMSEKAISIGHYFVTSGVYTIFSGGGTLLVQGAGKLSDYLFDGMEKEYGAKWGFEEDPHKVARMVREHIESKREALGINKAAERKLFDMEDRRQLTV